MNVSKTKWFAGSVPHSQPTVGALQYAGAAIERVPEFKYLGLMFTPEGMLSRMGDARLVAARKAWAVLSGKLGALGWRDRSARL